MKKKEILMKGVFFILALISIVAVIVICIFIFAGGVPGIMKIGVFNFLFGTVWKPSSEIYGILPFIIGSLYVTALALLFGVPLGIICAIYLAKFCPPKLKKVFEPAINLLAGIPSVVYGFFGLVVIVPAIKDLFGGRGTGILAAAILLGIMILPTIISVSKSAIEAVPETYLEAGLALGAPKEYSVFKIVVPAAKNGILAGVILGIGRAIGETMAVMMVAGNQPIIPDSILSGVRTLTSNIVLEMGYATDLHREALIGTAVVLFVFILIINLMFSLLKRRSRS